MTFFNRLMYVNHAIESEWAKEHPESYYGLVVKSKQVTHRTRNAHVSRLSKVDGIGVK